MHVFVLSLHIRQSISALSVCNIKKYNSNDYNVHYNNTVVMVSVLLTVGKRVIIS